MNESWDADIGSVRVHFGPGRLREAAGIVKDIGCCRVLLVSDPGIRAAGHLGDLQTSLEEAAVEVGTFTDVTENPTSEQVDAGRRFAEALEPDCIVALGGGSAMDCAKGINFLLTNGGQMSDYWGFGLTRRSLLPAIGIPTTAGTGSEAQSFALITDIATHRKMACGDPSARFRAVVLDPTLLFSVPAKVASATGLDAVSHAVESFVSTPGNPVSRLLSLRAWQLLHAHLTDSLHPEANHRIRGRVLLAAHLAGAAIEQSMLGAAHACANPLTALFGITHGEAVALMLPHVVRFNSRVVDNGYQQLAEAASLDASGGGGEAVATRIEGMLQQTGLAGNLSALQIPEAEIPKLATAAAAEWTSQFNPRPVAEAQFVFLYESAR